MGRGVARLTPAAAMVTLLAFAVGACGTTTVDPKSGETLIRTYVKQAAGVTLRSVRCPTGIKPKNGTAFGCKVTLRYANGAAHSGTITVHITGGGKKVEILGVQDVHLR